jgi:hypothetical protein
LASLLALNYQAKAFINQWEFTDCRGNIMAVDFDIFYDWCKDRFGEHNLKVRNTTHGVEICTHSYFAQRRGIEDNKFHLWMSPSGGKSKHPESGSYRCWKTDEMGSLVSLVAQYDGIDYDDAEELICGVSSLRSLEQKVNEFFGHVEYSPIVVPEPETTELKFPDFTFYIDRMSDHNFWKIRAQTYLSERKIPTEGLYVCTEDAEYGNRIILPWYDQQEKLFFWNARTMSKNNKLIRYLKPKNADQDRALFMTEWPLPGTKIYVMEGEFDAISLQLAGLVGCACGGKFLSDTQIEMIRLYEPVLVFDSDDAGLKALIDVGNSLLGIGFPKVSYVRPPAAYKDWNKFLQCRDVQTIKDYINKREKPFTSMTGDLLKSKNL